MAKIEHKLVTRNREVFGKGAARKLRAEGMTPAVLYGHGADPQHVALESHPLSLIVRHPNAVIELSMDGKKQLVLVKDVQRDPVRQIIEHVDLLIVKKGETVDVEVPILVEGEPFSGTTAMQELNTVSVSVPATSIPEHFVVNVDGLQEGTQVLVKDLEVGDAEVHTDEDELVVQVLVPIVNTESDVAIEQEPESAHGDEASEAGEAEGEGDE